MRNAAIELNDASLAIAWDGAVLLDGPGYAAASGSELRFGREVQGTHTVIVHCPPPKGLPWLHEVDAQPSSVLLRHTTCV